MYNIKERIQLEIKKHNKKIVLFMFILSIYYGSSIYVSKSAEINIVDFVSYSLTDFHIIIFVLIPLFLSCIVSFRAYSNMSTVLIRHKSFLVYYFCEAVPIIIVAAIFTFLLVIIPFAFSILAGLPFASQNSKFDCLNKIVYPITYLYLGLVFISEIIYFLKYIETKKTVLTLIIIEYMLSVIAVQWNIDKYFPYIFMNNYLIFNSEINKMQLFLQLLFIAIISFLTIFIIKKRWRCADLC